MPGPEEEGEGQVHGPIPYSLLSPKSLLLALAPWAMPLFLAGPAWQQLPAVASSRKVRSTCRTVTAAGRTQAKQQSAVRTSLTHLIVQERNKESQVPANPGQAGRFSSRPRSPCIPKNITDHSTVLGTRECVLFLFLQLDAVSLVSTEPSSSCCLLYPRRHPIPGLSFLTIDFDFLLSCYYVLAQRFHLISPQPEQRQTDRQTDRPKAPKYLASHLTIGSLTGHTNNNSFNFINHPGPHLLGVSLAGLQDHTSNRPIPTSSPPVDTGYRIQDTGHRTHRIIFQDTGPSIPLTWTAPEPPLSYQGLSARHT